MANLGETIRAIYPADQQMMEKAQAHQQNIAKPRGSLGRLEELAIKIAGMRGTLFPGWEQKLNIIMAADHGVEAEGVSASPRAVTWQVTYNFLRGKTAASHLSRHAGARMLVVDMGIDYDLPDHPLLIRESLGHGTQNMVHGPAMSRETAITAIETGMRLIEEQVAQGLDLIAIGEMGIGNTTASAAVICALTGMPPAEVVGRGSGVDDAGLRRKIAVVERSLTVNKPNPDDAIDVLSKVGGFELAGLTGVILGAAAHRLPVILDGYISGAVALLAAKLAPATRDYMLAGHLSSEGGHRHVLQLLDLSPILQLDMRLGEGTGALLALQVVEAALKLHRLMPTWNDASIFDYPAQIEQAGE